MSYRCLVLAIVVVCVPLCKELKLAFGISTKKLFNFAITKYSQLVSELLENSPSAYCVSQYGNSSVECNKKQQQQQQKTFYNCIVPMGFLSWEIWVGVP